MRVLHIVQHLHRVSGVTSFVVPLCDALKGVGVDCDIAVKNPLDADYVASEVGVRRLALRDFSASYDIVHIHNLWSPFLHRASNLARRMNVPVVWSVHGALSPWAFKYKWWKKCVAWHLYQRRDLMCADVLHMTACEEEAWTREAVGTKRFEIIPMGVKLPNDSARDEAPARKVLLFVGRLAKVKALDRLVQAFNLVEHKGWVLRIIGEDVDGTIDALKRIRGKDVEIEGPRVGEALKAEYNACSVLALVSHSENFGAVVLEAMSHGRPVLTSKGTPWKDAPGWWVDNDVESLARTLEDVFSTGMDEIKTMGDRARRFVEERFTWEAVAQRFSEVYNCLASRRQ